jgi:hypothetical protein
MGYLPNAVAVAVAVAAVLAAALVTGGSCDSSSAPNKVPPGPNVTTGYDGRWLAAKATWYGKPVGAGPDDSGGACGIKDVDRPPYSGMTSCGNGPIFKDGKGCGSCYEVYVREQNCLTSRREILTNLMRACRSDAMRRRSAPTIR